jgi:hypothetical protein
MMTMTIPEAAAQETAAAAEAAEEASEVQIFKKWKIC